MSVLVVLNAQSQVEVLAHWGLEFARARGKGLKFLVVDEGDEIDETGGLDEGTFNDVLSVYLQSVLRKKEDLPESVEIRHLQHPEPATAALKAVYQMGAGLMLVAKEHSAGKGSVAGLGHQLFQHSPWRTMLISPGRMPREDGGRVLVPAGGGPHSAVALNVVGQLAKKSANSVIPFFVERPNYGDMDADVGMRTLQRLCRKAGISPNGERVDMHVAVSNDVKGAIADAAKAKSDLVIIGEAGKAQGRYWMFDSFPIEGSGGDIPSLAVIRKAKPLQNRLRERMGNLYKQYVPQLTREERVDLFSRLETNSRWNFDFIALLMLSTAIAGLGLALNSTAVVIGAMLVAPLMTPIIGASLGLVQGNFKLMQVASKAIILGFFTAMLIGVVIGLFDQTEMNSELNGRAIGPGIKDLLVGLFSGLAAAYCTGRTNLSAALPGVAIAAALVPPIATTGICMSIGLWAEAGGAAALFGINVLTIIIGAALALFLSGVQIRKPANFAIMLGSMILLSILIGAFMWIR